MQLMHPVPSSTVNLRNLLGLRSRDVTVPTVSARERRRPLREKEIGSEEEEEEEEEVWVRVRKSKAKSFTWVLYSG
jgi:hypothetical protein